MDRALELAFGIALSYAIGTWVAGYYLTRWRIGKDIRELGSGSAGARNTARLLGRSLGLVAFAWDFSKGTLAVLLATTLFADGLVPGIAAVAVVLGHIWPAQLGFRGGKGVAPAAGALIVWQPPVLAAVAVVYVLSAIVTRSVERRALTAFGAGVGSIPFLGMQPYESAACAAILALLIWTHRDGFLSRKNNVIKAEATK
jgi:glycerol-3-phosphate acyltransferase PlsY